MFQSFTLRRGNRIMIAFGAALAAALLAALVAPVAAKADVIGGYTFTISQPSATSYITANSFIMNFGGSSSTVGCNIGVNTMNVAVPSDVQHPAGAVWEYWRGEQVADPTITAAEVYGAHGDPYVSGGTHVAWSYLFARNLTTGATYWWTGSAWSSASYQRFNHPAGHTYAIHDWVYFGMSNGTYTQWIDLGFRNSGAYQGIAHVITMPDCVY